MQQLKCTSCTTLNQPGETVCRECGASLIATSVVTPVAAVAPVAAVVPVAHIAPVAPIVERAPVMIVDRGMSDQAKILIGRAPVTQAYADKIGADGFAPDASSAVRLTTRLIGVS